MRQYRDEITAMGHLVTSRWIDAELVSNFETQMAEHKGLSDLEDIRSALEAVFFTEAPSTTGGMHVEFGYALARGRIMIVIGPYTNIFQKQANYHFPDWEAFKRGYLHAPSEQGKEVQATSRTEENA